MRTRRSLRNTSIAASRCATDRPRASRCRRSLTQGWFADLWTARVDAGHVELTTRTTRTPSGTSTSALGYGAALWPTIGDGRLPAPGSSTSATAAPSDDYIEWRANLFYRDALRAQLAYSDDYLQRGWSSWNAEVSGSHPLTESVRGEWGLRSFARRRAARRRLRIRLARPDRRLVAHALGRAMGRCRRRRALRRRFERRRQPRSGVAQLGAATVAVMTRTFRPCSHAE